MKQTIIIGLVIAAISGVVAAKIIIKQNGIATPACCPCSMISPAGTNTTGTADVE